MRSNLIKSWSLFAAFVIAVTFLPATVLADVAFFEDLPAAGSPLAVGEPGSEWHGNDVYENNPDYSHTGTESTFTTGGVTFNNFHDHFMDSWGEFDSWDGWAYSNRCDIDTTGMDGQFTAMGSGLMGQNGALGSAQYGIASLYGSYSTINFDSNKIVQSIYVTNDAYAYHSMLNGDSFAKKFGGSSGDDPDWFRLTIIGKNAAGEDTGEVVFYLADYRSANNDADYIVDSWQYVDLSPLGSVRSILFSLWSSDAGMFGMNTPAYFAMDNLAVVPEPASLVMLAALAAFVVVLAISRKRK